MAAQFWGHVERSRVMQYWFKEFTLEPEHGRQKTTTEEMHYRYVLNLANIIFSEHNRKEEKKYSTLFWCQAFKRVLLISILKNCSYCLKAQSTDGSSLYLRGLNTNSAELDFSDEQFLLLKIFKLMF